MAQAAYNSNNRTAWCSSTGLIAVPCPPSAQVVGSPALLLSHPSGTSFILQVLPRPFPVSGHQEYISYVSFSPNGELLLAVTSLEPLPTAYLGTSSTFDTLQEPPSSVRLVLWQATDCLNQWTCILDWDSGRARPAGPGISKIVNLRWFGARDSSATATGSGSKKRKRDVLGEYGGESFLAVLDTQECLFFRMRPDGTPTITISSLENGSTTSTDLCLAGLSLPSTTIDVLGNVIPQQSMFNSSSASLIPQESNRIIRHAAISCSECVEGDDGISSGASRVLVAYKSDKIPQFCVPATRSNGNPAGTMVEQLTGLPDPLANPGIPDGGNLLLPGGGMIIIPSEEQNLAPNAVPGASTTMNGNIANPPSSNTTLYQGDPYADINMSVLDDLLDMNFASSSSTDGNMGGNAADFEAFMSGAELNGSTSSTTFNTGLSLSTDSTFHGQDQAEKKVEMESPSKSIEEDGSSPRKNGIDRKEDENVTIQIPEKLVDQLDMDLEKGMIQLWEIIIQWETLSISSERIQLIPLVDSLDEPSTSSTPLISTEITSLSFLTPGSFGSSPSAHLLWATTSSYSSSCDDITQQTRTSSHQQGWNISRKPFELSDAFSNLEGKKKSPPLAEDPSLGFEWVVVGGLKLPEREEGDEGKMVLQILQGGDGRVWTLTCDEEGGFKMTGRDTLGGSDQSPASLTLPSKDPLSIVLSPNSTLALACAFDASDHSRMIGHPRIFPLPLRELKEEKPDGEQDVKMEDDITLSSDMSASVVQDLGKAIADCLLSKRSSVDLLMQLSGKSADIKQAVIRAAWSAAIELLNGLPVEKSRLLPALLSLRSRLFSDDRNASNLIQMISMQRLLQSSMSTLRHNNGQNNASSGLEIFEISAVWPIIGHIGWLFRKWDDIILAMTSSQFLESVFIIMHPLPRLIQQRLIRLVSRLANFILSPEDSQASHLYGGTGSLDIEVARGVLGDLMSSNRAKMQAWEEMLQKLQTSAGEKWGREAAREALITLRLPGELQQIVKETVQSMRETMLPLVESRITEGKGKRQYDILTRAVLPKDKRTKRCTMCDGRAVVPDEQAGEWELCHRRSCICRGLWVAE